MGCTDKKQGKKKWVVRPLLPKPEALNKATSKYRSWVKSQNSVNEASTQSGPGRGGMKRARHGNKKIQQGKEVKDKDALKDKKISKGALA